jgi:hypothetical protein
MELNKIRIVIQKCIVYFKNKSRKEMTKELTNEKFYEQWQEYQHIIGKFAIEEATENIPVNIFKVIEIYNEQNEQVEYMFKEIEMLKMEIEKYKSGGVIFSSSFHNPSNCIDIVSDLNNELYEKIGETERKFYYSSCGYTDCIWFGSELLWDSEEDNREWIEENNDYEPLEPFIKRVFNDYVKKLNSLKTL